MIMDLSLGDVLPGHTTYAYNNARSGTDVIIEGLHTAIEDSDRFLQF